MTTLIPCDAAPAAAQPAAASLVDGESGYLRFEPGLPPQPVPVGLSDHPRTAPRADEEIAEEIRSYLRRTMNTGEPAVHVLVEDGVVALDGQLDRQGLVHRLLEWTNGISGVVSVSNRLTARNNDATVPFAWGFPG